MEKRFRISIRSKLLLIISFILLASFLINLMFAIRLFQKDKSTYIYDLNSSIVRSHGGEVESGILGLIEKMGFFGGAYNQQYENEGRRREVLGSLFEKEEDIIAFNIYDIGWEGEEKSWGEPVNRRAGDYIKDYVTVSISLASVRSGPGKEHPRVGFVKLGQEFELMDEGTDERGVVWSRIRMGDGSFGWVSNKLLKKKQQKKNDQINNQGIKSRSRIKFSLYNEDLLELYDITDGALAEIRKELEMGFERVLGGEISITNTSILETPILTIIIPFFADKYNRFHQILVGNIRPDRILRIFRKSRIYTSYLVDKKGNILAHPDTNRVIGKENISHLSIIDEAVKSEIKTGTIEFLTPEGERMLGAYSKVGIGNLVVISQIPKSKAFLAAQQLIRKSILLVLVILVLAFITSFFFSLNLTNPLRRLYDASLQVAKGRFDTNVKVTSSDEIGSLTESFNTMVMGLEERERIRNLFGKFVSTSLAEKILEDEEVLKGKRMNVSVLFSDVRNFTRLSEGADAEMVMEILNLYFPHMFNTIFKNDGVVDKTIGDAIMAVFGVPAPGKDDIYNSVKTAVEMIEKLKEINKEASVMGLPEIDIGIGIHTGEAIAGKVGSEDRMEYTVIGDTVNVASRIEGLNKELKTHILISRETYEPIADRITAEKMPLMKVKGKSTEVEVYRVDGLKL